MKTQNTSSFLQSVKDTYPSVLGDYSIPFDYYIMV